MFAECTELSETDAFDEEIRQELETDEVKADVASRAFLYHSSLRVQHAEAIASQIFQAVDPWLIFDECGDDKPPNDVAWPLVGGMDMGLRNETRSKVVGGCVGGLGEGAVLWAGGLSVSERCGAG